MHLKIKASILSGWNIWNCQYSTILAYKDISCRRFKLFFCLVTCLYLFSVLFYLLLFCVAMDLSVLKCSIFSHYLQISEPLTGFRLNAWNWQRQVTLSGPVFLPAVRLGWPCVGALSVAFSQTLDHSVLVIECVKGMTVKKFIVFHALNSGLIFSE